jgi:hypothetical protein
MQHMDKNAIQADLRSNVVEVVFNKLDGTIRKMRGTLMPKYLPTTPVESDRVEENFEPEHANPNTVRVWDVDAKGWRSFRVDRVLSIQAVNTI